MSNKNMGIAFGALGVLLLVAVAYAMVTSNNSAAPSEAEAEEGSGGLFSRNETTTVPAGTVLSVQFDETVSSATSHPAERFTARVVEPVLVNGEVVIDPGSTVTGSVVEAVRGKKIGGRSRLNLRFSSLELPSGEQSAISASFYEQGKSQAKKDGATIGGATAGGAILAGSSGTRRTRTRAARPLEPSWARPSAPRLLRRTIGMTSRSRPGRRSRSGSTPP